MRNSKIIVAVFLLVSLVSLGLIRDKNSSPETSMHIDSAAIAYDYLASQVQDVLPGEKSADKQKRLLTMPLEKDEANEWIKNYYDNNQQKAKGFLIYTHQLARLLTINPIPKYVHILFAYTDEKPTDLTLVLAGVDAAGKHHYFSRDAIKLPNETNKPNLVLQHVMPCPPCIDLTTNKKVNVQQTLE